MIEDLGFGGAETLLGTLLPELRAHGVRPEVATLGCRMDAAPSLAAFHIPVHQCGLGSLKRVDRALPWLVGLIRRERYDLVHTHLAFGNLYGRVAAYCHGTPVTTTYHDSDYELEVLRASPGFAKWKRNAYLLADRITSFAGRQVVAVSRFVAESICRHVGYARKSVDVIYNGVPPSAWAEITLEEKLARRRDLRLDPAARLIVQVGRLSPQKGQTHTLEVAQALRHLPNVQWLLVGDGPLRPSLEATIARMGLGTRVTLVGGRADVRSFLAAADLFLFPSLHEGLGIAVLEAMAAALPVIAYEAGPLPEIIDHGTTGVLVPPGNVAALARAVDETLSAGDRSKELGRRARNEVISRFSITRTAEHHAALYRRLLKVSG